MSNSRYSSLSTVYGEDTLSRINNSRILVVGAGGIGCEVLKNLVMSGMSSVILFPSMPFPPSLPQLKIGFHHIDVIDLDTVDISNLNRQFLFRPEHVNSSKSLVAASSAMKFNSHVHIIPYHQNIKDSSFSLEFFSKYDLVLNALDNLDARRHVNRLCLAYEIPLIESGTTGYIGQSMPILKKITECYECQPKLTQKIYPICTIRSTPSQPVHCIVWGKEFFKLLFGQREESLLYEDETSTTTTTSSSSTGSSGVGESTFMKYLTLPECVREGAGVGVTEEERRGAVISYAVQLFKAFFVTEIEKKKAMGIYKTSDRVPVPLEMCVFDEAQEFVTKLLIPSTSDSSTGSPPLVRPSERRGWERAEWSPVECLIELICSEVTVHCSSSSSLVGSYVFDKDDRLAMTFVTAASALRAKIFHIVGQSSFHDAKGVAGNIIPAIASTNAIIAGLQVIEAIRLLSAMTKGIPEITPQFCRTTYCQRMPTRRGNYLQPTVSAEPNPKCYICGTSQLTVEVCLASSSVSVTHDLQVDTHVMTLGNFLDLIVKQRLGLVEPSIMIGSAIIYEEGEDSESSLKASLLRPLISCNGGGIRDGTIISLGDFRQDITVSPLPVSVSSLFFLCHTLPQISLVISHVNHYDFNEDESPLGYRLIGSHEVNSPSSLLSWVL
jgi:ubiquitin-like 1-activating enzyme E1 B